MMKQRLHLQSMAIGCHEACLPHCKRILDHPDLSYEAGFCTARTETICSAGGRRAQTIINDKYQLLSLVAVDVVC